MDIFVGIQSILVPVSSPIFGFILDSIQMAFGNIHYAILSGFRAGSWFNRFQRTIKSRNRVSRQPRKSIIYFVLALYSISVFSSLSIIRRISFVLLSLSRSFGTVGHDQGSHGPWVTGRSTRGFQRTGTISEHFLVKDIMVNSQVFNGNCVLINLAFPLQVFGLINGITEIFSTLAGILLGLISKRKWI